jgi:hypothetical protein
MENHALEKYFRHQQVSLQWLPILRALASELMERVDVADLRQLFFQIGERFAIDAEDQFQEIETLGDLEQALNELWQQMNWGWTRLQEAKASVDIHHHAAPLAHAFGDDALEWSIGILEGFYQHVFKALGAGDAMQVQGVGSKGITIHLRFSR